MAASIFIHRCDENKEFLSYMTRAYDAGMDVAHVVAVVLTWTGLQAAPPAQARAMVEEADAIWRTQGVSIVALTPAEAVGPVPHAMRLAVTLSAAPRGSRAPGGGPALGAIVFDPDHAPARALTIHVDAVAAVVARTRWGGRPTDHWPRAFGDALVARALGRVLAHEIGHYLLAWKAHSADGLMRAQFKGHELAGVDRDAFSLPPRDRPRLRARLAGFGPAGKLAENAR
jgi:hypothetical protein